jgi:hypothetical protein
MMSYSLSSIRSFGRVELTVMSALIAPVNVLSCVCMLPIVLSVVPKQARLSLRTVLVPVPAITS